jgi:hypothetical protein
LEVLFLFFGESKEPRGPMYSPNCWRVSEGPVAGDPLVVKHRYVKEMTARYIRRTLTQI